MKRILAIFFIIFCLTGCSSYNNEKKESNNPDKVFEEELKMLSSINELPNKKLADEVTKENVEGILDELFQFAVFEENSSEYGEVIQGIGSDGNGGRIYCCKLPVNITFLGDGSTIDKFVRYFYDLENVVSIGNFNIEMLQEGKVKVETVVNFLGKSASASLTSNKKEYSIKHNAVDVEMVSDIVLRDFDISMTLRPSNSDSAAITLGVVEKQDYRVYNDENAKKEVTVNFYKEGKRYYCSYKIGDDSFTKAEINPKGNILFDILSCDLVEEDDEIGVDVKISNESDKKVSTIIYNDNDKRVNIAKTSGNIEVNRQ